MPLLLGASTNRPAAFDPAAGVTVESEKSDGRSSNKRSRYCVLRWGSLQGLAFALGADTPISRPRSFQLRGRTLSRPSCAGNAIPHRREYLRGGMAVAIDFSKCVSHSSHREPQYSCGDHEMASKASDQNNPLLSTPVATVAASILPTIAMFSPFDKAIPQSISAAVELVTALVENGHLPRQMPAEETSVEDAVLIAQGFFLGLVRWDPYSPGDPRGTLYITAPDSPQFGYQRAGKLEGGMMPLDDAGRQHMKDLLAKRLRRL